MGTCMTHTPNSSHKLLMVGFAWFVSFVPKQTIATYVDNDADSNSHVVDKNIQMSYL